MAVIGCQLHHLNNGSDKVGMMGILFDQLSAVLPLGMVVPPALAQLYDWIERHRFVKDQPDGMRWGLLFPESEMRARWTNEGRPGGTDIGFIAAGNQGLKEWMGLDNHKALDKLCIFARTGGDGSQAAFWLDDKGQQRIVHLGSGSGSILACILADDVVDFLRLLAIGYDAICWDENFTKTPQEACADEGFEVKPNVGFQHWVRATFGVTIPRTGIDVVRHPAHIGDTDSPDAFNRWLEKVTAWGA